MWKLVSKAEDADVVLEVRSGGVGTDSTSSYLGIPEIGLPGMVAIPEVKLINRESQKAAAKIGLVVYDAKTKRILGDGGTSTSTSDDNNTYVLGFGPWQNGSLRSEMGRATTPQPAQRNRELPTQVAFEHPQTEDRPGRVRYTGGGVKLKPVSSSGITDKNLGEGGVRAPPRIFQDRRLNALEELELSAGDPSGTKRSARVGMTLALR